MLGPIPARPRPREDGPVAIAPSSTSVPDVAVVGGGVIGASVAAELAAGGASVVVLERGSHLAAGCSWGNAGVVGPSHVVPLAGPEAILDGLRWLGRRGSPFALHPRPAVAPWLARFLAASTPARVAEAARVLRRMALRSAERPADLVGRGLQTGYRRAGLLNVYDAQRAFAAATAEAARDRDDGIRAEVLDAEALRGRFAHVVGTHAGAVLYPDDAHCDPGAFVRAIGDEAVAAGAEVRTEVEVLGLRRLGHGDLSLWTTAGELRAGQVVLAAGAWSPRLARDAGARLPVQGGKGYHVEFAPQDGDPEVPTWFQASRVVATPMPGRVRVAGTLELAGVDMRVDRRRVDALVHAARTGLRGFGQRTPRNVWRGLRPCSPDGLPIIGRVPGRERLVLATGHGMWGLQLGPLTGRLVADVVLHQTPSMDLRPLRPERFA
jgi:D-amino-acid dehydrogenase